MRTFWSYKKQHVSTGDGRILLLGVECSTHSLLSDFGSHWDVLTGGDAGKGQGVIRTKVRSVFVIKLLAFSGPRPGRPATSVATKKSVPTAVVVGRAAGGAAFPSSGDVEYYCIM